MKNTGNPISVDQPPTPIGGSDYSAVYGVIKQDQEKAAQASPELPYEINSFPQRLGNILTGLFEMRDILQAASTADLFKTKRVDHQIDQISGIIDSLLELNNSIYDLKL
jgi:hypothetical protein